MQEDQTKALHICNEIKRQIEKELPHLKLVFIAERLNNLPRAFEAKKHEIAEHPAGAEALKHMEQIFAFTLPELPYCTRLFKAQEAHIIPFLAKEAHLVIIITDLQQCEQTSLFKRDLYKTLYKILPESASSRPNQDGFTPEKINMLQDCFATLVMAIQSKKNIIAYEAAQQQCKRLFRPITGYKAETRPYPIALDAMQILLQDLRDQAQYKDLPIHNALAMTEEIAETITEALIKKWVAFAQKAQYLAWGGHADEDILSMAVHASEDTQIRAIANMVADTLKITPPLRTYFDVYNPFTAVEANERHHISLCKREYKTVINAFKNKDLDQIDTLIYAMNKQLAQGRCMGWCAHALAALKQAFIQLGQENPNQSDFVQAWPLWLKTQEEQFDAHCHKMEWTALRELAKSIFHHRREGHLFSGNSLLTLIKKSHPDLYPIFEETCLSFNDKLIYDPKREAQKLYEEKFGGLSLEGEEEETSMPPPLETEAPPEDSDSAPNS